MVVTELRVSYLTSSLACCNSWSSTYHSRILSLQKSNSRNMCIKSLIKSTARNGKVCIAFSNISLYLYHDIFSYLNNKSLMKILDGFVLYVRLLFVDILGNYTCVWIYPIKLLNWFYFFYSFIIKFINSTKLYIS